MLERSKILYEDDEHQVIWFGWEEEGGADALVQSNQMLLINQGRGYLLDPGGAFAFSAVADEIGKYINLEHIHYILASHQDPDVLSSITLWLQATPARLFISRLWTRFVSHFGFDDTHRLCSVPDQGGKLTLPSGDHLLLLPAHFLHSEGNFCFYDSRSRILFSGDIGAAVFPSGERYLWVEDFAAHCRYMEAFHRRYMSNNRACRHWVAQLRGFTIDMIVPQHGAIMPRAQVEPFLAWLEQLECGTDLLERIYQGDPLDVHSPTLAQPRQREG